MGIDAVMMMGLVLQPLFSAVTAIIFRNKYKNKSAISSARSQEVIVCSGSWDSRKYTVGKKNSLAVGAYRKQGVPRIFNNQQGQLACCFTSLLAFTSPYFMLNTDVFQH